MLSHQKNLTVKLADSPTEIEAAQRLRYSVFVKEMGADASAENHARGIEQDKFDTYFDHLLLIDTSIADPETNVVGVYRLVSDEMARAANGFYSSGEYDLAAIEAGGRRSVELGRSCIAKSYRGGIALQMLWDGLADYVRSRRIEVLFGVASFHGTDPAPLAQALSFLHHNYLAPAELRATALPDCGVDMDIIAPDRIDRLAAVGQLPQLIKSYLRLGGFVGQGAYVDHNFNTLDVFIVMDTTRLAEKYAKRYSRDHAK